VRYPACRAAKWDDLLVDQDDPEKRIAELERRLAERQRFAEPRPSLDPGVVGAPVGAEAPTYRSFTATAPRMNMRTFAILFVYGGIGAMVGLPFALNAAFHVASGTVTEWEHWLVLGGYGLVALLFVRSSRMRSVVYPKVSIRVIGDGLEVTRGGRGQVFPLSSAKLGPWATSGTLMGTALHVRSGRHRFVVGGQNHRVPPGVRFDARSLWNVDAWMAAQDFEALLRMVYR
jgi:hypothetical protein